MESSGKPEQVHISQETSSFLGDAYYLEEGEEVFGKKQKPNSHRCNAMLMLLLLSPFPFPFPFECQVIAPISWWAVAEMCPVPTA